MFHCWLKDLYGSNWPEAQGPTHKAIAKSIERLKAKLTKLKKRCHDSPVAISEKNEAIVMFLQEKYVLPKLGYYNGRIVNFSPLQAAVPTTKQKEYVQLKQKLYATQRNTTKRLKRREKIILEQKNNLKAKKNS